MLPLARFSLAWPSPGRCWNWRSGRQPSRKFAPLGQLSSWHSSSERAVRGRCLPRLMRRFAPVAASPGKRPLLYSLPQPKLPFNWALKHPRALALRPRHRQMPPETPASHSHAIPASRLRHARCLFHPLREAAARCPHCGGTFCRECVTDEEEKLACPPCLRRLDRPPAAKASPARLFREILTGFTALVCLAAICFVLLRWRTKTPEQHLQFDRIVLVEQSGQSHE